MAVRRNTKECDGTVDDFVYSTSVGLHVEMHRVRSQVLKSSNPAMIGIGMFFIRFSWRDEH